MAFFDIEPDEIDEILPNDTEDDSAQDDRLCDKIVQKRTHLLEIWSK